MMMYAQHFLYLRFWAIFLSQYLVLVSITLFFPRSLRKERLRWVLFCFAFVALFCFSSCFSLTFLKLPSHTCTHACVRTTDVHTPWYKTWFCCFGLWSCDKWLEFSEALGQHAVYAIHLRLQDSIPFHHSTWWDSVHCPTVGPSWVKLKADRLGAKDPWCGEAISLSSRLWNQYQRDAGLGVGKPWTTLVFP